MLSIHWFRRDLRLEDNASLYHALRSGLKVQPVFIFDKNILSQLDNNEDARVNCISVAICVLFPILDNIIFIIL